MIAHIHEIGGTKQGVPQHILLERTGQSSPHTPPSVPIQLTHQIPFSVFSLHLRLTPLTPLLRGWFPSLLVVLAPGPGLMSHKVSHLPCQEFSLQFPAFLLKSFNLLVFCQESTGLLCQVLGTLVGKCFFAQFQAGALQRHWSSYLHQRAVRCVHV